MTLRQISPLPDVPGALAKNGADSGLRGTVVRPAELSASEVESWARLCESNPNLDHPFFSPGFTLAAACAHPNVFVCRLDGGRGRQGFLPFQFASLTSRMLRAAEPVGDGLADYFGVVASPDLQLKPRELLRLAGLSTFAYHHLPESQGHYGLGDGEAVVGHRMLIGSEPTAYWQELKRQRKSFVAESERRQRKVIEAYGPLRFTFAVSNPVEQLRLLVARKRAQYNETKVADSLKLPWKRKLLEILAESRDPLCTGVLSTLYAGETWVASHFGLRNSEVLHYWFPVYNEKLARFAPGHLLIRQIIENGRELGIAVIDRGAGDQPHKTVYLTQPHHFYKGTWYRPDARSVIFRSVRSAAWRLQRTTRKPNL